MRDVIPAMKSTGLIHNCNRGLIKHHGTFLVEFRVCGFMVKFPGDMAGPVSGEMMERLERHPSARVDITPAAAAATAALSWYYTPLLLQWSVKDPGDALRKRRPKCVRVRQRHGPRCC